MQFIRVSFFTAAALVVSSAAFAAQAPQGDAARGKAAFESYGCYACHGYQGQGAGTGARLAPGPRAWPAFSTFVRTTSGAMPPYTEKVMPTQALADVHAYLATIPAAPDSKSIPLLQQIGN